MPQSFDYSTLWEAFASGKGWGDYTGTYADAPLGEDVGDVTYGARTKDFYSYVIGPAFGYDEDPTVEDDPLFGEAFGEHEAFSSINRYALDAAEAEFRMAIGDPYMPGQDPFIWQKLSRYDTSAGGLEAQELLEGELYGKGALLGGTTGTEYGQTMAEQKEEYSSTIEGLREGLTYEGLTKGVGTISGASGTVLRSGATVGMAEDIIEEVYEDARGARSELREGIEGADIALGKELDDALSKYLDVIDREKEDWYSNIMMDVQRIKGYQTGDEGSAFTAFQQEFAEEEWGGLTYDAAETDALEEEIAEYKGPSMQMQEPCEEVGGTWIVTGEITGAGDMIHEMGECTAGYGLFREDIEGQPGMEDPASEACGIGMLWATNPETGVEECMPEEGVAVNEYGQLFGTGEGLYSGCIHETACNYNPEAETDDGSCEYTSCADDCDVPNGDNSSCTDCKGIPWGDAVEDECGVCEGDGTSCDDGCGPNQGPPDVYCESGDYVCDPSECDDPDLTPEQNCLDMNGTWDDTTQECDTGCQDDNDCTTGRCNPETGECMTDACSEGSASGCFDGEVCHKGTCTEELYGCTDPNATGDSYNPDATTDDNSCIYEIYGCTDAYAANYDPEATDDDGSCEYDEEEEDVDGPSEEYEQAEEQAECEAAGGNWIGTAYLSWIGISGWCEEAVPEYGQAEEQEECEATGGTWDSGGLTGYGPGECSYGGEEEDEFLPEPPEAEPSSLTCEQHSDCGQCYRCDAGGCIWDYTNSPNGCDWGGGWWYPPTPPPDIPDVEF